MSSDRATSGAANSSDGDPLWSPDGKSVALVRADITTDRESLVVIKPPTATAAAVYSPIFPVDGPGRAIAWSPDSQKIACLGSATPEGDAPTGIVVVGANGTNPKLLAGTAGAIEVYWQPSAQ